MAANILSVLRIFYQSEDKFGKIWFVLSFLFSNLRNQFAKSFRFGKFKTNEIQIYQIGQDFANR